MAGDLDALVWAVSPRHDSLDKMLNYIVEYGVRFLDRTVIRCRLDIPNELPAWPVSSDIRHNAFLIVKEALNNAAKYSGAEEIRFRIRIENRTVILCVEDNGKGFVPGETRALGNGLLNMRKRAENIGGCLELSSEPGKGTRLHLKIPLRGDGTRE
jgi:signal transduction histidine kinase